MLAYMGRFIEYTMYITVMIKVYKGLPVESVECAFIIIRDSIASTFLVAASVSTMTAISYPESSGFLVSGATPGRLWGHRKNSNFLIGCSVTVSIVLPQKSCGNKIRCPQSLPGVAPLTKKPEDSGYEIAMTAISVDRYLAIHYHLQYQVLVTERRMIYFQITLRTICGLFTISRTAGFHIYLILVSFVVSVCLSSTCFAYSKIFIVLRRHQSQIKKQIYHHTSEQEQPRISNTAELRRLIVNTFYVFFAFLFCFLPYC